MRGDRGKPTDRFSGPANDKKIERQAPSFKQQATLDS